MKLALIDRVLLKKKEVFVRGVELFNIALINDLTELGYEVHLYINSSWLDCSLFKRRSNLIVHPFHLPYPELVAFPIAMSIYKNRCEKIIIANVSNGLLIPLMFLNLFGIDSQRWLLIAHRMPKKLFLKFAPKKWKNIICVNSIIAQKFLKYHFQNVIVEYGKNHPENFYPPQKKTVDGQVNFCMLGNLDSPWKGVQKVVNAFSKLPFDIRKQCKLHLASYKRPPSIDIENIIVYSYLPPQEIPDWLRKMDVMIVASYDEQEMRETFCMAMVEGMLTGLPILTYNLPILTEKISEGGGKVFNSEDELVSLMTQMVLDSTIRQKLGQQAREIALKRYVWNTASFASRYLAN